MVEQVTVAEGKVLTVKTRLKVRDTRQIHEYSVDGMSSDGKTYRFNVVKHAIATAAARITHWQGFQDEGKPLPYPAGKPFPDRVTAIETLDEDEFEAISTALNQRFGKIGEDVEKNAPSDGEPG